MTRLWCSSRSRIAVATTGSPNTLPHSAAGGEFADLPRIERGLGGKVETVEIAHCREVGNLARHLDAPLVLAGDLVLDQKAQRLAQAQLALGGLVQQAVELVADG